MSEVKITPIEMENGIGFKGTVSISDEELKNRVDFLEQHTKEFSELVIKTENELYIRELLQRNENLKQELNQYKNNWEELKKWLKKVVEIYNNIDIKTLLMVLDKMKELEGE